MEANSNFTTVKDFLNESIRAHKQLIDFCYWPLVDCVRSLAENNTVKVSQEIIDKTIVIAEAIDQDICNGANPRNIKAKNYLN